MKNGYNSRTKQDGQLLQVRNELTSATKLAGSAVPSAPQSPAAEYAYQYDDIGNRITSTDFGTNRTYVANSLNQYTLISNLCDSASLREEFIPLFDDDGNQTLIQTSTGVWSVQYNGENRPVLWTGGTKSVATNIVMSFDRMGRRVEYLETAGGSQSSATETNAYHHFVYDGYVCVIRCRHETGGASVVDHFVWDPTEPVVTRPLVFCAVNSASQYYVHDGNKNVANLLSSDGVTTAHYEYDPFGTVICNSGPNAASNPYRFSSECSDETPSLVYYNYRHYDAFYGRWLSRGAFQLSSAYRIGTNMPMTISDVLGVIADKRKKCKIYEDEINCLGYAVGVDFRVDPYEMSIDGFMKFLGYKGLSVSDKECKCDTCDKKLVYVYIYINANEFAKLNKGNLVDIHNMSIQQVARLFKRFKKIFLEDHPKPLSEEDFWCKREFGVDYHAMTKNCEETNGPWRYVPARFDKKEYPSVVKELSGDSFFNNTFQVIAGKCYKKEKVK